MTSGKNVSAISTLTRSTMEHVHASTFFHVKVDFGLEVDSRPALLHVLASLTLQTTSEISFLANLLNDGPEH